MSLQSDGHEKLLVLEFYLISRQNHFSFDNFIFNKNSWKEQSVNPGGCFYSWLIVVMTKILIKPNSDTRTIVNDKSLISTTLKFLPVVLPESSKLRNDQP